MIRQMLLCYLSLVVQCLTTISGFGQQSVSPTHTGSDDDSLNNPAKRALIIAISAYNSQTTGWSPINADRDARMLKQTLIRQGFFPENIRIIADHEATKKGIIDGLTLFTNRIGPGDIVYFHFSGHGQQITDDNGDEVDGYDEALIPIDAHKYYNPDSYDGRNHLRDDELKTLLNRIRSKAGSKGSVLVTIDACHSGTATRGPGVIRGSQAPFNRTPSQPVIKPLKDLAGSNSIFGDFGSDSTLAAMMVLSASGAHQNNFEFLFEDGSSMGSLTYALCKSLGSIPANSSYLALFHHINHIFITCHPHQQPQYEGDAHQLLFCGMPVEHPRFSIVSGIINDSLIHIDGGFLNGITINSKVGLFPPGTYHPVPENALAEGVVSSISPFNAVIKLSYSKSSSHLEGAWCVVTALNYKPLMIRLGLSIPAILPRAEIINALNEVPFITVTDSIPEVLLICDKPDEGFQLLSMGEIPLLSVKVAKPILPTNEVSDTIINRLWSHAQALFLRELEARDPEISFDLKIIPFISHSGHLPSMTSCTVSEKIPDQPKIPAFNSGDKFYISVMNTGNLPFFFNLFDIQPDHIINPLLPSPSSYNRSIYDMRLEPGQTFITKELFIVGPPYGTEILKCIATSTAVDLSGCFTPFNQTNLTRCSNNHPLLTILSGNNSDAMEIFRSSSDHYSFATETLVYTINP
jgi:metacaspase-1